MTGNNRVYFGLKINTILKTIALPKQKKYGVGSQVHIFYIYIYIVTFVNLTDINGILMILEKIYG